MKHHLAFLTLSALLMLAYACNRSAPLIEDESSYIKSIEQWQQDRLEGLKAKDGWLNLAGIYWLKQGNKALDQILQMILSFLKRLKISLVQLLLRTRWPI